MSRSVSNGRSERWSVEKEATGPATDTARKPSKELVMNMVKRCLGVISVLAVVCLPAAWCWVWPWFARRWCPRSPSPGPSPSLELPGRRRPTRPVRRCEISGSATSSGSATWSWPRSRGTSPLRGVGRRGAAPTANRTPAPIEPYYGKDASGKLFGLLAGHYGAVKQYLEATVAGSKDRQDAAYQSLSGNASEIARFLSEANPNLPYDTLNGLLLAHGGHHVQQIQQVQRQEYAPEAQTWDTMKRHMYVIADALAGAIAKQFAAPGARGDGHERPI